MLKFLGKLLGRDLTTPSEPIDTNVSEDEIWETLHPNHKTDLFRNKKSLQAFLEFAMRQLSKTESQRLCRVAKRALSQGENMLGALGEVVSGEEGQRRGQWAFIQLDYAAWDEIAWQASEILKTYGVNLSWDGDCKANFSSTVEALSDLSHWLIDKGFALLHFETESDSYYSIIVKKSDLLVAKQLAAATQLTLYEHAEFFHKNG